MNAAAPPSVVRYPTATADSATAPDTVLAGPHTRLCQPRDIAVGPNGELYVLSVAYSHALNPSGRDVGWKSWVMVYDARAHGDAPPVRSFAITAPGFGNAYGLDVDRAGHVYVTSEAPENLDSGSIAVFEPGAGGNVEPVRMLSGPRTGLHRPIGLTLDRHDDLYVTNLTNDDDTVRVFAAGADGDMAPCRMIAGPRTRLSHPIGLALDRKEQLYVANAGSSQSPKGSVTVYAAGAKGDVAPRRTITTRVPYDYLSYNPRYLALDGHDTLYVRAQASIDVFPPGLTGKVKPTRATEGDNLHSQFAFDRHDTLYAIRVDTVSVYAPGSGRSSPLRRIVAPRTRLPAQMSGSPESRATGIALDGHGALYVAESDSSSVAVYSPGANGDIAPIRTIAGNRTRLNRPMGLALDRENRLYVTNDAQPGGQGAVRVYDPAARGEAQPIRSIVGPATGLSQPTDIAFDSHGDMYVPSNAWQVAQVAVYDQRANGNAEPLRTITGPHTGLHRPIMAALGRGDTLYVVNAFDWWRCSMVGPEDLTVTIYPPGASGDIAPLRTVVVTKAGKSTGRRYGLRWPAGLAVDSSGAVYLSVSMPNAVVVYAPGANGAVAPIRSFGGMMGSYTQPTGLARGTDGGLYVVNFPEPLVCR